jgi:hypothetical protein
LHKHYPRDLRDLSHLRPLRFGCKREVRQEPFPNIGPKLLVLFSKLSLRYIQYLSQPQFLVPTLILSLVSISLYIPCHMIHAPLTQHAPPVICSPLVPDILFTIKTPQNMYVGSVLILTRYSPSLSSSLSKLQSDSLWPNICPKIKAEYLRGCST